MDFPNSLKLSVSLIQTFLADRLDYILCPYRAVVGRLPDVSSCWFIRKEACLTLFLPNLFSKTSFSKRSFRACLCRTRVRQVSTSSLCRTASLISLTLSCPNSLWLPVGLPGFILRSYTAVVDKFLLVVLHLRVPVKGSIGEYSLWVRPSSSSGFPHVLFI